MKTIFLTVYDGDTEKVILRSGVFARLKESGNRIVLLIRGADRLEYYHKEFASENVMVELLPRASSFGEKVWYYVGWNTLPTFSTRLRQHMVLDKNHNYPQFLIGVVLRFLGHSRIWREFLRFIYRSTPDAYASKLFTKYKPDVLFSPNMFSAEDMRMLRGAEMRRGVKTITTAKSWDVLTTKAFTRIKADKLLVFNSFNREEAIAIGDYLPEAVEIVGFPQFDVYARSDWRESREEFCAKLGLDPVRRIIMVAVPGDWKTPYTKEILAELDKRIEEGKFVKPIQILARLHPKYSDSSEKETYKHVVIERPGTALSTKKEFSIDMGISGTVSWTFTDKDIAHLANSLLYSDIIINTESTLSLDAAALDRPVILVAYDGNHQLPYWDSIARLYERNHYRHVIDTHASLVVKSHDELEKAINTFLEDPDYLHDEREDLKRQLLFKIDGHSAERMADAILNLL